MIQNPCVPQRLYTDYKAAVEHCKTYPDHAEMMPTRFHVQWIGSEIGRMQAMTIKAFLTSQQTDKAKLTVWTDRESDNEWVKELKGKVEFKVFNPKELIQGTPFEGTRFPWWNTDIMRMVYLSKYGGVHIDMDTVLLRDLSPLLNDEFFYTWGTTDMIAGGIINLFRGSPVNNAICKALQDKGRELGYYRELFGYVRETHPFKVYPCAMFNTEWAIPGSEIENEQHAKFIRSPVVKTDYSSEFYDGVFSWHWHNCWTEPIEEGSKWELMEQFINKKYEEKYDQ